jgi:hypothetical protein
MTVFDVFTAPAGSARDEMIHQWCISVWEAYSENWEVVSSLLSSHKII